MKTALLIFSLLLLTAGYGAAQPPLPDDYKFSAGKEQVLEQANKFYRNGEVEKAASGYRYLVESGVKNGYLFYNLGNAEFQLGNTGKAVLWYERARRYLPRFDDLNYNLRYVRRTLVDEEFRQPDYSGTAAFLTKVHQFLNLRESLIVLGIVFWMFAVVLSARILIRSEALLAWLRSLTWISGIVLALGILSTVYKIYDLYYEPKAIVMVSALDVKTGAGANFSTHFSLHEGTKVRVQNVQDNWARIDLPAAPGFTGYVPLDAIEII